MKSRNPVKDIVIDFSSEPETDVRCKTIHACDLQGNVYRLTKPNPAKLEALKKGVSDEKKQEDYADWLRRRGNTASGSKPAGHD